MPPSAEQDAEQDTMYELITLINRLQDVAAVSNVSPTLLDLPQMAVVGEQSAGKSSVLEHIVGKDFLPRGTGIVTRCPLVLQLINHTEEYAQFLHLPDTRFTDFESVKLEITAQTEKLAGGKKGITNKPINLKIYSPDVPHLTLVDLPGLTKVQIEGQPANIEEVVRELILEYIKHENTLILAVTQATQDLVNSDALKIAQMVDPRGLRTIGVITKLDMMDNGTDARAIMENKTIPLRRGYVGLVNRSQDDINQKRDIKFAQDKEARFFRVHPAYKDIANRMGSRYLRAMLSQQLQNHIREKLPSMKALLKKENSRIRETLDNMNAFEEEKPTNWQQPKLIELVQKFVREFEKELEGLNINADNQIQSGGAKLNECFYIQIQPLLNQNLVVTKKELYTLWVNNTGFRNMMYFAQIAFDSVVGKFLRKYKDPLGESATLSATIIKQAAQDCVYKLEGFPYLRDAVVRLVGDEIMKNEDETKLQLLYHIKAQKAFMNIYHPDFLKQPQIQGKDEDNQSTGDQAEEQNGSDWFDDDRSTVEEYVTRKNEVMRGNINIHSTMTMPRSFYFVLTIERLMWFKNEFDSSCRGSIPIDGLKVTVTRGRAKTKKYLLERAGTGKDTAKMIISFNNDADERNWLAAFDQMNVTSSTDDTISLAGEASSFYDNANFGSTRRNPSRGNRPPIPQIAEVSSESSSQENLTVQVKEESSSIPMSPNDPRHQFVNDHVLEEVMQKLVSYALIVKETINDVTPKYISYFLVQKTLKYARLKLLADLSKEEDWPNLMRISDEERSKRDEYIKIYEATENALKVMGEVSTATPKTKGHKNK